MISLFLCHSNTVDGRNPAPPGIYFQLVVNNGGFQLPTSTGDRREILPSTVAFRKCITFGQIIATSHDRVPPKGSVLEGKWDPLFQGNPGW